MDLQQLYATRILFNKQMQWQEGEFRIWKVPGAIFPLRSIAQIAHHLLQDKQGAQSLYAIGEQQTILAVVRKQQQFGIKRNIDLINSVLDQSAILGLGSHKFLRIDLKRGKALISFQKNPFAQEYKALYGKQQEAVDAYLCGCLAGIFEAVCDQALVCVETKCLAKGDRECLFEIMPVKQATMYHLSQCKDPLLIREEVRQLHNSTL